MDAWVYVVVGIVAVAIIYFGFLRKKPELPPAKESEPSKLTSPEAAEHAAQKTKQLAPATKPPPAEAIQAKGGVPAPTPSDARPPEPLGSSDVLPASDVPIKAAKELSKKDVAGI